MSRIDDTAAAGDASPAAVDFGGRSDPPLYQVTLWPHRSLTGRGFLVVMAFTGGMLALPLIPLAGTAVALGLLPFLVATFAALGYAIRRNARDGRLTEELRLWPDLVAVVRREPRGRVLRWQANPHWVRLTLHKDHRLENYLTLNGAGREIELGAFLSPEERADLAEELERALARAAAAVRPV